MPQLADDYSRERVRDLVASTPPAGKRRPLAVIAAVATLGSLLFGYDTGVIAGALPYMYMPGQAGGLALTTFQEGWVGGLLSIGAALGAALGGRLSDRYGRRHNITMLAVIFVAGALGCTFSVNIWMLYLSRLVLGFAVGGASATVPVFLSETAPTRLRGSLVAIDQFMIVAGQFLAYSMNALLARSLGGPTVTIAADPSGVHTPGSQVAWEKVSAIVGLAVADGNGMAWRYMLVLATIPAVALWIGIRLMPESSRWYAANLRITEAIGSLKRIRTSDDEVIDEIDEMLQVRRREVNQEKWGLKQIWGQRWTRRILLIGITLGLADQVTGINTAMYYLPKILSAAGFSTIDAITLNVVSGFVSFLGSALNLWIVAHFARRHVGIYQETSIVISLAALAGVFFFYIEPFQTADGSISGAPVFASILVVVIVCLFVFAKQSGTISWVLLSEIFPAHVRGAALGLAVGANWIGNAIVTIVFPLLMQGAGPAITYGIFALLNVGSLLFYLMIVPETRQHSLESLEMHLRDDYR